MLNFYCSQKSNIDKSFEMGWLPGVVLRQSFSFCNRFRMTADRQKDVFVRQLKIASAQDKPLVIHCRRAEDDTFLIMKQVI